MAANLGILVLLAGCHGDEPVNPFDDWGPYKGCERDVVYSDYDVYDPNAGPYPGGELVDTYTAQGGLLQEDQYGIDYQGKLFLQFTTLCSYDESTHAPLACDVLDMLQKKPQLYFTDTYGYRADGLIAWQSRTEPYGYNETYIDLWTATRDGSDRIVRVDADFTHFTDKKGNRDVTGVPYASESWIYDPDSTLPNFEGADAIPTEIDSYDYDQYGQEYLTGVARYTIENHEIVRWEQLGPDGEVDELHEYTYDDGGHYLTDVRDGGWETYTWTWDGDFLTSEIHEVAWKDLSDVRTDYTADVTYDCGAP